MEQKKNKIYLILVISFLIIATLANFISYFNQKQRQFSGIIEKVEYSEKKIPAVTVNGISYGLSTNWKFNQELNIGDSLIKEKELYNV